MNSLRRIFILLVAFSVAMGFFEAVVVIYLRQLYYPNGFQFPLVPIAATQARLEFLREGATIIMLITVGMLAGKNKTQGFAFFLLCFGIWDICYYISLKIFLDWPASLFTWDILFLIPVPWVGPVFAPCIVSLTMITAAILITSHSVKTKVALKRLEWILFGAGGLILIVSFTWDYFIYVCHHDYSFWTPLTQQEIFDEIAHYVPASFNWPAFVFGELLVIAAVILSFQRRKNATGKW